MSGAKKRAPVPWGEAHRREALRRTYEIAAERAGNGTTIRGLVDLLVEAADHFATGEALWRLHLEAGGFDNEGALREVRRVRALAEGRLVRSVEQGWKIRWSDGSGIHFMFDSLETANAYRSDHDTPSMRDSYVAPVRVARIRRAAR